MCDGDILPQNIQSWQLLQTYSCEDCVILSLWAADFSDSGEILLGIKSFKNDCSANLNVQVCKNAWL